MACARSCSFVCLGLSAQVVIMEAVDLSVDDLDLRSSFGFPAAWRRVLDDAT